MGPDIGHFCGELARTQLLASSFKSIHGMMSPSYFKYLVTTLGSGTEFKLLTMAWAICPTLDLTLNTLLALNPSCKLPPPRFPRSWAPRY